MRRRDFLKGLAAICGVGLVGAPAVGATTSIVDKWQDKLDRCKKLKRELLSTTPLKDAYTQRIREATHYMGSPPSRLLVHPGVWLSLVHESLLGERSVNREDHTKNMQILGVDIIPSDKHSNNHSFSMAMWPSGNMLAQGEVNYKTRILPLA